MSSKVKISVEDGASHGISVSRNSTTTGQTYETRTIAAGEEAEFDLDTEQTVVIGQGAAVKEAPAEDSTKTKKKG